MELSSGYFILEFKMTAACNLFATSGSTIAPKGPLVHSRTLVNGMPQIHTEICKAPGFSAPKTLI
jgi:hypothetical protein